MIFWFGHNTGHGGPNRLFNTKTITSGSGTTFSVLDKTIIQTGFGYSGFGYAVSFGQWFSLGGPLVAAGRKLRPIWDDGSKFRSKVVEFVNEGVLEELTHYALNKLLVPSRHYTTSQFA